MCTHPYGGLIEHRPSNGKYGKSECVVALLAKPSNIFEQFYLINLYLVYHKKLKKKCVNPVRLIHTLFDSRNEILFAHRQTELKFSKLNPTH